jgi:predicted kinase
VLTAGYSVIIDATFLKYAHRDQFRTLAAATGTAFLILECTAENSELKRRIVSRSTRQDDASEATLEVLHAQQAADEPLSGEERQHLLRVDTRYTGSDVVWSAFQDWIKTT